MRHAVIVIVALLATWMSERFFDAGVLVALLFAATGLFVARAALLAAVMPIAAFFCIDPGWRTTTVILYSAFIVLAVSTRRRKNLTSAGIALALLALEIFLR